MFTYQEGLNLTIRILTIDKTPALWQMWQDGIHLTRCTLHIPYQSMLDSITCKVEVILFKFTTIRMFVTLYCL